MPADLTITFDDAKVQKKLHVLATGVRDFRTPLTRAGDQMLDVYGKDVFETKGKAIGDDWRDLSAATLMMREKRVGYYRQTPKKTGVPMLWTGRLASGFAKRVKRTSLRLTNNVPYFKFHQQAGGTRPPQRKMLSLSKDTITIVITEINKYVVSLLK